MLATRLLLLGIIDISAFPGMITPYLSPAYVLICVAVVLSFAALKATAQRLRQPNRDSGPDGCLASH